MSMSIFYRSELSVDESNESKWFIRKYSLLIDGKGGPSTTLQNYPQNHFMHENARASPTYNPRGYRFKSRPRQNQFNIN
jgi:hypothetical protein